MSKTLQDLCPTIRTSCAWTIARLAEGGIAVLIVDTLRTSQEQADNIARGVSWTKNSKHLPQVNCPDCGVLANSAGTIGLSHAIDLAPYSHYELHGPDKIQWNAEDPAWQEIGRIGEEEGLAWGGRWKVHDLGHLESKRPYSGY